MKISILGAGPAGLYFALLMKRSDPRHDITVVERNAPDATFGWGVVFSEGTLGTLRDADYETYVAITDNFARWDPIDIHYRGRVMRARGQAFAAISRKVLLQLLQARCRELGVEMRFYEEVPDLARFGGSDLIVAADGVNSTVRPMFADVFQPSLDGHRSKYVWFGTDPVFDAFTFIFEETPAGMF